MGIRKDQNRFHPAHGLHCENDTSMHSKTAAILPPGSDEDIQKLIHELEVHQIELELQNEELRNLHADLELSRDNYSELFDFAPVGYF